MSARRHTKRQDRDLTTDDEGPSASPSRKDWMREVQRTGRTSRVLDLPESKNVVAASPRANVAAAAAPAAAPAAAAAPTAAPAAKLSGMFAMAVTPLTSGGVDRGFIADYAAALKSDSAAGVIIGSGAGEGGLLSVAERNELVSAWAATGARIIVDVTAGAIADAQALASHAAQAGAVALVAGLPAAIAAQTADDAAAYLAEVCRGAPRCDVLYSHSAASCVGLRATDVLRAAAGRCQSLRGCVFAAADLTDLAGVVHFGKSSGAAATVIHAHDGTMAAAALSGVTAFASPHCSTVCPLLSRIVAAAQKADAAGSQKLHALAASYFGMIADVAGPGGCDAPRTLAAVKAVTSFRLERDLGHVRAPGPRLTVLEVQKLRAGMEAFVSQYTTAVGATPAGAAAPAATGTKINVHAMPGYLGKLDDKIRSRAEECGRRAGVRNILRKLPHLGRSWRGRMPGKDCDAAKFIDHTVLKPEATAKEITKLTAEAKKHGFYAVCVNGCRVEQCVDELAGSGVEVAAVIGFPLGAMNIKAKAREAREIVAMGATEIDMVMNVGAMKDGDLKTVYEDIKAVVDASAPGAIVKVIFETCLLTADEIMDASILSVAAGAGFIKTSTGFNKGGATPEAIDIMLAVAGNECQVKASGGVRTGPDALAYITAGVRRIGTSSGVAIVSGTQSAGGY